MTNPGHREADDRVRALLQQVHDGTLDIEQAVQALRPSTDLNFAVVDHDRQQRTGLPEVVFCQGKRPEDAAAIAANIVERSQRVLLTRAGADHAQAVRDRLPDAVHHERARCVTVDRLDRPRQGLVAIVAAGTADLPVAAEAAVTAEFAGCQIEQHTDVGVAGLHRLLARIPQIRQATCSVAVAGMEGALPSVLAGLVDHPVIAVPTSIGYGAHLEGLTPLLAMMNSCAAGVAVVNIDNGFGGGYLAAQIGRQSRTPRAAERPEQSLPS
ncbi:MAG: nickel pincer cofactor biosynthesis protein LarB [Planctomycetota bacterium]|nr:nickel pincer cofactor biosynthesis protein LarB [Planctomycetota bacterium]